MYTTEIQNLLSKINNDWFKEKYKFFLGEGFYDKENQKIFASIDMTESTQVGEDEWENHERELTINIDLNTYCWDSYFYGSSSYGMLGEDTQEEFPLDSKYVADEVIELINKKIEKFTDVNAINKVIKNVVETLKSEVERLKQSSTDKNYNQALDEFVKNTRKEISDEFRHIKDQLKLNNGLGSINRILTPEICSKIASIKLENKKFITSFSGELDEGSALFNLLSPKSEKKTGLKINIEDWKNNDVYFLLMRLSEILTERISVAAIEKKKALHLNGKSAQSDHLFPVETDHLNPEQTDHPFPD